MDLDELVATQRGVVLRQQALDAGLSRPQIARRLRSGRWTRLTPTVYALASAAATVERLAWAAILAGGEGCALGMLTAAARWHLPVPTDRTVHVISAAHRHPRMPRGVVLHRVGLPRSDIVLLDGLPTTSRARTLVDCLRELDRRAAASLLDRSLQQGWVGLEQLRERLADEPGRAGNRQLRRLLRAADPAAAAESERILHLLLRHAGLTGWQAGYRHLSGAECDVAFQAARVALEIDGWAWHTSPERFQRDRDKQNLLVREGWIVLRFTWWDLVERPAHVVETTRAALAASSRRAS